MERRDHVRERFEALVQQRHVRGAPTRTVEQRRSWWRRPWSAPALVALGLALGSITLSHAAVIQCGAVLGPGGRFVLESNLDCLGPSTIPVTIRDGAILDLNGYRVKCHVGCVALTGEGAQLWNGSVAADNFIGIRLEDLGGHTVRDVRIVTEATL
jgi:hypothetical protein